MELNLSALQADETRNYDICIMGSGPAAFALALQFIQQSTQPGIRVAMLESSSAVGYDVQNLYDGVNAGLLANRSNWPRNYCLQSRLRTYGGTSNHWGGWSWPLEPSDLAGERVPPKWPIAYNELLTYYKKAQKPVMQLGAFEYDNPQYWIDHSAIELEAMPLPPNSPLRTRILQFNNIAFQQQYGAEVQNSRFVDVYRDANVTSLETEASGPTGRVSAMVAQTIANGQPGQTNYFTAKYFVLAAGAVATTRFLLLCGLGNSTGHLGQHFMDDPYLNSATFTVHEDRIPKGVYSFYFGSAKVDPDQRNISLQSLPALSEGPTFIAGLVPKLAFLQEQGIASFRVLLGGVGNQPGTIQTNIEPLPTSTGTISLSDRTDPVFGQREVEVDWQLTPTAKKTGEAMFDATRDALETLDYGSSFNIPQLDDDRVWSPGLHPMGTTRMAADQQDGVVDSNMRVFDTSNLYVASSSTFPTAGYQNPTFTICALALRLADFLKTEPAN